MALPEEGKEYTKKVLKALDKAILEGPWEKTPFFRGIGKKLQELRNTFKNELGIEEDAELDVSFSKSTADSPFTEIYISLYQADGNKLPKWTSVIASLQNYTTMTRPIFKYEEEAQAFIRSKINRQNDAYVVVKINKENILQKGNESFYDREGRTLLLLKEKSIQLSNVIRFVHSSGEYTYEKGMLVKMNSSSLDNK